MTQRYAITLTLGLVACFAPTSSAGPAEPAAAKPNVLFLVGDDLNCWLGCYGHPLVKTPNIDKLAARGVRFERAYCQDPICNPSRTSFLSGRRPGNKLADVVWLPDHFRKQGWFTIEIPKVAHSYGITRKAIQWDLVAKGGVAEAIELMRKHQDKPFFLGVGLTKTHDAVYDKKYLALYPLDRMTWPKEPADARQRLPAVAFQNVGVMEVGDEERRRRMAAYCASITTVDAEVGRLLEALDQLELTRHTVIVFTSDHGKHKGEHGGVWDKRTLFEASVRVPLIVAAPGRRTPAVSRQLVELVDLYPTLTELCGIPSPKGLEGTSLVPLLDDPTRDWKKAAFTFASANKGWSVRSERYRYSEWNSGKDAILFDYQIDPDETTNLASDPKHQDTVAQMRRLLRDGWQQAVPPSPQKGKDQE